MEERKLKVIFGNDGRGGVNTKVSLPITWLRKMGIVPEDRDVIVQYDEENNRIIISKK